jgi:hypothetical protein
LTEGLAARWDADDPISSDLMMVSERGCFVRAVVTLHLDGGHELVLLPWVRVEPDDFERVAARWGRPSSAGLVLWGELANEIPSTGVPLGSPMQLEIVNPAELPHVVNARDPEARELLYGEWAHSLFLRPVVEPDAAVPGRPVAKGLAVAFLVIGGVLTLFGGYRLVVGLVREDLWWTWAGGILVGLGIVIILLITVAVAVVQWDSRRLARASSPLVRLSDDSFDSGKIVMEVGPLARIWEIAGGTELNGWALTPAGLATILEAVFRDHAIEKTRIVSADERAAVIHLEASDDAIAAARVVQNLLRDGFSLGHAVDRARYYGYFV